VLIQRLQRNKRKFVTVVTGLEHFGVKLKDAAQCFKKKFSCGSAVVAGECGKPDEIDIQVHTACAHHELLSLMRLQSCSHNTHGSLT